MKTKALRAAIAQATGMTERRLRDQVQESVLASGLSEREVLEGLAARLGLRVAGAAEKR